MRSVRRHTVNLVSMADGASTLADSVRWAHCRFVGVISLNLVNFADAPHRRDALRSFAANHGVREARAEMQVAGERIQLRRTRSESRDQDRDRNQNQQPTPTR